MRSVTIDFLNHEICVIDGLEKYIEYFNDLDKTLFDDFYPGQCYRDMYACFTWDFQNERFLCNQSCNRRKIRLLFGIGHIMENIVPMKGLSLRYSEFLNVLKEIGLDIRAY